MCRVKNCEKVVVNQKNRLCKNHYYSFLTYGDPTMTYAKRKASVRCGVVDCSKAEYVKGYCAAHYMRFYRTGKPDGQRLSIEDRFWSKVKKTSGCWEWQGSCHSKSHYGTIGIKGKTVFAHRYSYSLKHGVMPKQMVLHSCDNRICVNPSHLREGTAKDNAQDMVKRGRVSRHRAKLTEVNVRSIYLRLHNGISGKTLAEKYQVSHRTISNIKCGITWQYVTNPLKKEIQL